MVEVSGDGANSIFKNFILVCDGGYAVKGDTGGGSCTFQTGIIYNTGTQAGSIGIDVHGGTTNTQYVLIEGFEYGARGIWGSQVLKNCAVFNNINDFDGGSLSATYTASDDNDVSGTGNYQIHSTYTDLFNDYLNHDYSLKNYTSTGALIEAGNPISGIDYDIIGTARDGSTPDVGPFEYFTGGPSYRGIFKRYNGASFVNALYKRYNGASFVGTDPNYKTWDGDSFEPIDTSG